VCPLVDLPAPEAPDPPFDGVAEEPLLPVEVEEEPLLPEDPLPLDPPPLDLSPLDLSPLDLSLLDLSLLDVSLLLGEPVLLDELDEEPDDLLDE
jgi:hypothetical protein